MYSYGDQHPTPQQVLDDLGDKFVGAFISATGGTRKDLDEFKEAFPQWFISYSQRFIANFIHERTWDRMVREVGDHPGVTIVDQEPTRQIIVDGYIIRFKRHRPSLQIRTYPTSAATAFWTNQAQIPGTETRSLALGYIWDPVEGAIKDALMSYRADLKTPVWSVELDPPANGVTRPIGWKSMTPGLPQLDLSDIIDEEQNEGGSESEA